MSSAIQMGTLGDAQGTGFPPLTQHLQRLSTEHLLCAAGSGKCGGESVSMILFGHVLTPRRFKGGQMMSGLAPDPRSFWLPISGLLRPKVTESLARWYTGLLQAWWVFGALQGWFWLSECSLRTGLQIPTRQSCPAPKPDSCLTQTLKLREVKSLMCPSFNH